METKKRFSILKCVIIVICVLLIVVSIIVNIMFSGGKTPKVFGNYIYVVKASDNMGGNVTEGAALIAPDAKDLSIAKGGEYCRSLHRSYRKQGTWLVRKICFKHQGHTSDTRSPMRYPCYNAHR